VAKQQSPCRRPRKERKNIAYGVAHIKSSFNNTIVSIATRGNISLGLGGNVASRLAQVHSFAAQLAAEACAKKAMEHGVRKVDVLVRGRSGVRPPSGRSPRSALRSWHQGRHPIPTTVAPKKRRRV